MEQFKITSHLINTLYKNYDTVKEINNKHKYTYLARDFML